MRPLPGHPGSTSPNLCCLMGHKVRRTATPERIMGGVRRRPPRTLPSKGRGREWTTGTGEAAPRRALDPKPRVRMNLALRRWQSSVARARGMAAVRRVRAFAGTCGLGNVGRFLAILGHFVYSRLATVALPEEVGMRHDIPQTSIQMQQPITQTTAMSGTWTVRARWSWLVACVCL